MMDNAGMNTREKMARAIYNGGCRIAGSGEWPQWDETKKEFQDRIYRQIDWMLDVLMDADESVIGPMMSEGWMMAGDSTGAWKAAIQAIKDGK